MPFQALAMGSIVGLSLGLTGGGGAIFAVPLLVYGLSIDPRQAVGISLAAVGMTSLVGLVLRWKAGQVEIATGLMVAMTGMIGAPIGIWASSQIPESLLLLLFGLLMLVVAARMGRTAGSTSADVTFTGRESNGPTCRRDAAGNLQLTSPCALRLSAVGLLIGILSGLFGVSGGFVIVPALVLLSGMAIHRAVGTSLMIITLISASGIASHVWAGRDIPFATTSLFGGGGVLGMFVGIRASHSISGPALQRLFAVAIMVVAIFIILRTSFVTVS